jgi:hypothetical protein
MRAACVLVGMILIGFGCGGAGGGKPAATAGEPAGAAVEAAGPARPVVPPPEEVMAWLEKAAEADPTGLEAYCWGYAGCAEERTLFDMQRDLPKGAEVPKAELARRVSEKVVECLVLVNDLTYEQFDWLLSCTGCGGTCGVYDCMDRVLAEASEPFECDLGMDLAPPAE